MPSRTGRRVITLLAAAVLSLAIAPVADAARPPDKGAKAKPHCASRLVRLGPGKQRVKVTSTRCFTDLASAVRFAQPGSAIPDQVTAPQIRTILQAAAMKSTPSATTIIGIHWEHAGRGGRDRIYYVKGAAPCAGGRVWQINKLDAGWDTLASSAEAFGGCGTFSQFSAVNWKGQSRVCTPYCASLGGLNDHVKSVRWRS